MLWGHSISTVRARLNGIYGLFLNSYLPANALKKPTKSSVDIICHTTYASLCRVKIMTKKKKTQKKLTERVNLRITKEEFQLLESASEKDERSLSNWARRVLVREAKRQLGKKK